jgi:hypothetical protein
LDFQHLFLNYFFSKTFELLWATFSRVKFLNLEGTQLSNQALKSALKKAQKVLWGVQHIQLKSSLKTPGELENDFFWCWKILKRCSKGFSTFWESASIRAPFGYIRTLLRFFFSENLNTFQHLFWKFKIFSDTVGLL